MKIKEIINAQRPANDSALHYRRTYLADVRTENQESKNNMKVLFTIEMDPIGNKTISFDKDATSLALLDNTEELEKEILVLEDANKLK